jgi:hypothetical protein
MNTAVAMAMSVNMTDLHQKKVTMLVTPATSPKALDMNQEGLKRAEARREGITWNCQKILTDVRDNGHRPIIAVGE